MNRIFIIIAAVFVVAGAFPAQSHTVIDQVGKWLDSFANTLTPGQQLAVIVVVICLLLVGGKR